MGGGDTVQDIYAEVPPEWPHLPPVPPHHSSMQKDQECVEISQEELERQVRIGILQKIIRNRVLRVK